MGAVVAELTAHDLYAYAESFATAVAAQAGETLDFSPASLTALDAVFSEWLDLAGTYGDDRPPDLSAFTVPAAAYLGEVLIRALGGRWVTEPEPEPSVTPHVVVAGPGRRPVRVDVLRVAHDVLAGTGGPGFAACFAALAAGGAP